MTPHGKYWTYNEGCRCVKCRAAWADYQRGHRAERRAVATDAKRRPCEDCGGTWPPHVMVFHHRDPTTKAFVIAGGRNISLPKLLAEIAKCDVLCANCHAMRHPPESATMEGVHTSTTTEVL